MKPDNKQMKQNRGMNITQKDDYRQCKVPDDRK